MSDDTAESQQAAESNLQCLCRSKEVSLMPRRRLLLRRWNPRVRIQDPMGLRVVPER